MNTYPSIIDMRLQQLKFAMDEYKIEAAYISYLPNIKYLTNFSGTQAELIIHKNTIHFFTDSRYAQQIQEELYPLPGLKIHITDDIWKYCRKHSIFKEFNILGFEADKIPYSETIDIRNRIRPVKFKPSPYLFEPFTQPKGKEEFESIQKAAELAQQTYEAIIPKIKTRMTEEELAILTCNIAYELGSQQIMEPIFITSGNRGPIIHGRASEKRLKKNEIVMINYNTAHNGFICELSRTVALAKATKQQQNAYKAIIEAQELAIETVVPGMTGQHLDNVVRDYMKKKKLDRFFPHALGYGIGRKIKEHPFINPMAKDEMIPDKTVLAISPGVYTEKFGMRVQDLIVVSVQGSYRITTPPQELPIIEV